MTTHLIPWRLDKVLVYIVLESSPAVPEHVLTGILFVFSYSDFCPNAFSAGDASNFDWAANFTDMAFYQSLHGKITQDISIWTSL